MRSVEENQNGTPKPRINRGFSVIKNCYPFLMIFFYLFVNFIKIYGEEILVVHKYVGSSIDLEEKIHFGLFPDVPNFVDAQFFKVDYDKIEARIQYRSVNGIETEIINYKPYEVYCLLGKSDHNYHLII